MDEFSNNNQFNLPNLPDLPEIPKSQIDFGEKLRPNKPNYISPKVNYTSDELYRKRLQERDDAVFYSGVGAIGAYSSSRFLYDKINNSPDLLESFNKLPGASLLEDRLKRNLIPGSTNIDPSFAGPRHASNSIQSMLLAVEEASPLHILKTLQLSSFNTLFVEIIDQENKERYIKTSSIQAYKDYYKNLILNGSGYEITDLDIENGFTLKNNKLYQTLPDGNTGKELLGYARVINTNLEIGSQDSPNRVFQKFANIQGVKSPHISQLREEPLAVVGAASKKALQTDWIRSYARFSTEIGFKVLDNPLGFVEEIAKAGGGENNAFINSKAYQAVKNKTNISLGTNGVYDLSVREGVKRMSKNIAVKSTALYLGYNGTNALLDNLLPEDSVWHKGVIAGLSSTYANARIGVAEVWSDHFQDYKAAQEEAAPESTSLTTLLALPLAGAMGGANLAYFSRMKDNASLGLTASSSKHTDKKLIGGIAGDVLSKLDLNKTTGTTLKRYSKVGAIAGAALTLPYLPGALIGRSSEELRAEYSGASDVEVKSNRWWLMGGEAIEGGKTKYFRKSLIAENIKDAKNKTLYESTDEKRALDPIYSPFRYIQNPYAFEEKHKDDMPYPVWGMDVTYGSFLGKAFQGTAGEIIKPTVVNPELKNIVLNVKSSSKVSIIKNIFNLGSVNEDKGAIQNSNEKIELNNDLSGNSFEIPVMESASVKSLVSDGLMLAKESPRIESAANRAGTGAYSALSDFTGLKGFTANLTLNGVNLSPENQLAPELAVSGSGVTAKDAYRDMQLGDAAGAGEFIRRLIPQSAGTNRETINPMRNLAAPSWLPKDENRFYKDFSRGNYYDHQERGEVLLPGKGYAELTPELKDLDPEDYPLAYRYKILQNVAKGSAEHQSLRDNLAANLDSLSDKEKEVFFEGYAQEQVRDKEKTFYEYKTQEQKSRYNPLMLLQNTLWESFSHKESPFEPLTPFRPMAKFIHQRTAVEDYIKTQIQGSDAAIWTKPIDHFIKPSQNRLISMIADGYKPKEVKEKERVDEFFDKLELVKSLKNGDIHKAQKTITALSYTGIKDAKDMRNFKAALPDNQKAYVESFSKEKNREKREEILKLLPTDIGRAYQSIWSNIDLADAAKLRGKDPQKYIQDNYRVNSRKLQSKLNIELTSEEKEGINSKAAALSGKERQDFMDDKEGALIRLKAAEKEAVNYIENQVGALPSDSWIGWDQRLTSDDIKLKTLTVGKEDIQRYGYWDKDKERNDRLNAFDLNDPIAGDLELIKRELKSNKKQEHAITSKMRSIGFEVSNVQFIPSSQKSIVIKDSQEYLENYNG